MTSFPRPWIYVLDAGKLNQWIVKDSNGATVHQLTTYRFDPVVEQIVAAVNGAPADRTLGETAVPREDLELLASAIGIVAQGGLRQLDVLEEGLAASFMKTARKYKGFAVYLDRIVRR